jgi:putative peptide zinc metalloprotease protein
MAGVLAELAIASTAAVTWVHLSPGVFKAVCYNLMFVASASTILFNGNPLLRFDAYYVLSDLLEIPNLGQRANAYLGYLVRRYLWAIRPIESVAYSASEAVWLIFYGISSFVYRVYIFIRIILFMNSRLPQGLWFIIPVMAASGLAGWVLVPAGRFIKYLLTSGELAKRRAWAIVSSLSMICAILVLIGLVRVSDPWPIDGIIEPNRQAVVYTLADGFVQEYLPSGLDVQPTEGVIVRAVNPQLESQKGQLYAQLRRLQVQRQIAQTEEVALVQILDEQIQAVEEQIQRVETDLANLELRPPVPGTWISPDIDKIRGLYLQRGQQIGQVASLDDLVVRATAGQDVAAMIVQQADRTVQIRPRGYPQYLLEGNLAQIWPAGLTSLPSAAMGMRAGGKIPVRPDDPNGIVAAERVFQVLIEPVGQWPQVLRPGHRVVVRIYMRPKPLIARWWTRALQVFQKRFQI